LLCYALAVSRLSGLRAHLPVPRAAALVVVAYSAVCMSALFGQNSILTAGLAALALHLLGLTGDAAPAHIAWLTRRENFLPMDDSPFVNEWFVPQYNE
ncbi:lysine N(6)-hydroxylase/L-ornithine N(5)-oxygenase family protein, partial [Enterobacter sp. DRP3]|nr:lysine N(6)-hydroxylase/L-ornithine N(5)-oxygenase family protein [Enterobacter sp. DRP3]